MDSSATMNMTGGHLALQPHYMEQSILSHPAMTLAYRRNDGSTDGSASDEDSMPGLVNDSDDEDDGKDVNINNNVMNNFTQNNTNFDMVFDEESMCQFLNELKAEETDISEPDYIEMWPIPVP
jgi:hypothetical protein